MTEIKEQDQKKAQELAEALLPITSFGPQYIKQAADKIAAALAGVRGGIEERVSALPRLSWNSGLQKMTGVIEGGYYEAEDVLAAINEGEA